MSLATRCTACGTVFRVVQDQLKISEGWVRCGRCKDVFNALEGLFDLEREAPPQWQPPGAADAAAAESPPPATFTASDAPLPGALHTASVDAPVDSPPALTLVSEPEPLAADVIDSQPGDSRDFADARFNTQLVLDDAEDDVAGMAATAEDERGLPTVDDEPPAFLRETVRDDRWSRPGVRVALGAVALGLLVLLAGQWLHYDRDRIAAEWPAARPLLAAGCETLGCRIEAPRRIEDIVVESSALTRAPAAQGDALRLVVALRNRSLLALAMPTLELSLTDANGGLVARRALSAADLHQPAATLAPAAETSLQALLANPGVRIAGYTVEIFYP